MHEDSLKRLHVRSARLGHNWAGRRPNWLFQRPLARSRLLLAGSLAMTVAAAACDDSFTPIAPGAADLSVFGYLDASADTQWIRITPIRPLALTSPDSFDATVTLEHVGTGSVVELRDSLFKFTQYNPDIGSEGIYLHNYWTTEKIQPGATYRLVVARAGEVTSEAVVSIPADYEVEVWLSQVARLNDLLQLGGVKHVAFFRTNTYFYDVCGSAIDQKSIKIAPADSDLHVFSISRPSLQQRGVCGRPAIEKTELWVAGSEAAWPAGKQYSVGGLAVTEGPSNISHSLGYVGGVLTRTIPYERCAFEGPGTAEDYCRLRYDDATVTLSGIVAETRCSGGPLDSVTVQLRELDPVPPARVKVRTTLTNRSGEFRIGALEPGMRYAIKVRAKPQPDPFWGEVDIHNIHTDTLEYTRGEQAHYDVGLQRLTACWLAPAARAGAR